MNKCGTCGQVEDFPRDSKSELRPYGPGGEMICYRCAFATPETEARTEANFNVLLDAALTSNGGIAIIGETDGPR